MILPSDRRLLCVQPEPKVRASLAAALGQEGFRFDMAATGAQGLAFLRRSSYDLVIADARPGALEIDFLARAAEAGVLGRAISLLISGPAPARDFDLTLLVAQVHTLLAAAGDGDGAPAVSAPEPEEQLERAQTDGHAPVQLTLYVSADSPSSLRAQRRLHTFIARFPAGHVDLQVRDLARDPGGAEEEDRVVFTPTLVRKAPLPKVWVIGDLDDPQLILDLLTTAGVEPSP